MLIPHYVKEQICCSEVLLLTVLDVHILSNQ